MQVKEVSITCLRHQLLRLGLWELLSSTLCRYFFFVLQYNERRNYTPFEYYFAKKTPSEKCFHASIWILLTKCFSKKKNEMCISLTQM